MIAAKAFTVLSNTFIMYYKTHVYHWNIEGKHFSEFHNFFGDLYEELWAALDPIAEHIRTLGVYAPISVENLYSYKTIFEDVYRPTTYTEMLAHLLNANSEVIKALQDLLSTLEEANHPGFANFVADRIDIHEKHGWKLRAYMKGE